MTRTPSCEGGFLALDWCDGTPLIHLARRSFALHAELAEALGGDWGYRRMTTYAGTVGPSPFGGHPHTARRGKESFGLCLYGLHQKPSGSAE